MNLCFDKIFVTRDTDLNYIFDINFDELWFKFSDFGIDMTVLQIIRPV